MPSTHTALARDLRPAKPARPVHFTNLLEDLDDPDLRIEAMPQFNDFDAINQGHAPSIGTALAVVEPPGELAIACCTDGEYYLPGIF